MKARHVSAREQWGWPVALAGLTLFGLLSALLGEGGLWWALSWTALATPLLVSARHVMRPSQPMTRIDDNAL
ncbi:hypothetical protein EDF56_10256 [Novosphingobium sp. PhB165]|uniref:hypothetical protein n=1 Tax=Novosphingobium sp. PhB165 TaxID=2485105 RepID=UPI0010517A67|nr:hypothetical protein [Novosphingobium sp. PhB165]TCM20396.1 hypothetical protein EDF56_10256 [Novosphingobium sp. PhB165]